MTTSINRKIKSKNECIYHLQLNEVLPLLADIDAADEHEGDDREEQPPDMERGISKKIFSERGEQFGFFLRQKAEHDVNEQSDLQKT